MGHVRDLPENKLGIDIEHDFKPEYRIIPERKIKISELKDSARRADVVILATDPDREGEAIAYHVMHVIDSKSKIKNQKSKFSRIVFHEITKPAILEALKNPRGIDMQLVDAQQARRVLDRLVGYKLSPLLWNKLGKRWLSAGRVQSVALRIIVEREKEIKNFRPEEYWIIEVELTKIRNPNIEIRNEKGENFTARLMEIDGMKADVKDKVNADKIVEDLKRATYKIKNIEKKETKRYAPGPFTTSTMQMAASNKFGWSAKRTMRAAQKLYEEGLITYHRTDSTNIAMQAITSLREFIGKNFGSDYLPLEPKIYKTKSKVAQEAHEAIRPTDIGILGGHDMNMLINRESGRGGKSSESREFPQTLGRDQEILYSLIWKRFAGCQMTEAVFDDTRVDITANVTNPNVTMKQFLLRANGRMMKFPGWLVIYGQGKNYESGIMNQEDNDEEAKQKELPELTVAELLKFLNIMAGQKFTEPPPRYTEASLIKILEEKGIGRPSTYAPIISTIQDRKYVEKIERKLTPTDLGMVVSDFLVKYFPDVLDLQFSAKMEDELDSVARGEMKWGSVLHEFYDPLSEKIQTVYKEADRVKVDLGQTDEKCETCGSPMVIRLSKFGKFLACSRFPECKYTKNIIEKAGIMCPSCGGDIIVKKTRRGKQFYGCGNYPDCKFAAWKKEEIINKDQK